jgi:ribosomal protein L6P/L9E
MDALLSAALQEVAVEGIQGELQKNFENRLIDLQQNWKLVVAWRE